jgi:hypothetical protein
MEAAFRALSVASATQAFLTIDPFLDDLVRVAFASTVSDDTVTMGGLVVDLVEVCLLLGFPEWLGVWNEFVAVVAQHALRPIPAFVETAGEVLGVFSVDSILEFFVHQSD